MILTELWKTNLLKYKSHSFTFFIGFFSIGLLLASSFSWASKTDKNNVLPVTWHGPEPGIGLRNSAELSQIP